MTLRHASDRQSFFQNLELLENGDCLEIDSFAASGADSAELLDAINSIADRGADFVSLLEGVDTRSEKAANRLLLMKLCLIPLFRFGRMERSPHVRPWQSWT